MRLSGQFKGSARAGARPAYFSFTGGCPVARAAHAASLWVVVAAGLITAGCRHTAPAAPPASPEYNQLPLEEVRRRANSGTDARALRELAYRTLQQGDAEGTLRQSDLALTLDANSADAHNIRGMAYAQLSRPADAAREFQTAVKCAPKRIGPRLNLGRLFLTAGQYAVAAQVFQEALRVDPKSNEAAKLAGDAWRLAGSSLTAQKYYRKALEIHPDDPQTLARLGEVLVNRGRCDEAREILARARELGDQEARTRSYLGLAWAITAAGPEEAATALEHLEGARAAGEQGSHVYYGLGLAYLTRGDLKQSARVLNEGLRRYPDVPGLHYTLADVLARTGRAAESQKSRERSAELTVLHAREERFVDALSEHPNEIRRYLDYADWLLGRGEGERALPVLQQALRIRPKDPEISRRLTRAQKQAAGSVMSAPGRKAG